MLSSGELRLYFAVTACYIGAYLVIFIFGYPSPTQKQLMEEGILDNYTLPIFVSTPMITKLLGMVILPFLVQLNISINVIELVFCVVGGIGWILIISAESALALISGVGLVGLCSGITIVFLLTYVSEISLKHQRRFLSGGIGMSMSVGLFVAFFMGIWLSFRWLAVVGLTFNCLFSCLLLFLPHSPVWYVRQGMQVRAVDTLLYLHGNSFDADREVHNIQSATAVNPLSWKASLIALKDPKVFKPILLISSLAIFKELGGRAGIVSFSSHLLENQQGMDPNVASLFYPGFLVLGSLVSICIINKCRLKLLLMFGSSFQALSQISMAIYFLVYDKYLYCNEPSQLCRIITFWPSMNLGIYSFAYALGFLTVLYSLRGIMYTSHREISTAITGILTNITSYIVASLFYILLNTIGGFWLFLSFAFVHIISLILIHIFVQI